MRHPTRRVPLFFLLTALAFAVSGCMTLGRSFPTEPIKGFVVGKTTREDVRAAFGEPYRTGVEDGDPTWTYLRYHISAFSGESTRDLFVRFDAAGKVKSYAFNTNEPDAASR
jgi:outer membrane protein assembly factor BamE (lipoprotein component of BamABCDE complex)